MIHGVLAAMSSPMAEGFYLHADGLGCICCLIVVLGIAVGIYALGKRKGQAG